MITTADAVKVMSYVAACHHRTAPRMDDREAVLAMATIWADLFNEYKLELDDLLKAVKKRGARIETAPEPAEIIKYAREIRQERSEVEDEAARTRRELRNSIKVAPDDETALRHIVRRTGQQALGRPVGEAS